MPKIKSRRKSIDYLKWFKDNGWTMGLRPSSVDGSPRRWYAGPRGGCPSSGGLDPAHWTEKRTARICYEQEMKDKRDEARYQTQLKHPIPNTLYTRDQFMAAFIAYHEDGGFSHDEFDREMSWAMFQDNVKPFGHLNRWLKKAARCAPTQLSPTQRLT